MTKVCRDDSLLGTGIEVIRGGEGGWVEDRDNRLQYCYVGYFFRIISDIALFASVKIHVKDEYTTQNTIQYINDLYIYDLCNFTTSQIIDFAFYNTNSKNFRKL